MHSLVDQPHAVLTVHNRIGALPHSARCAHVARACGEGHAAAAAASRQAGLPQDALPLPPCTRCEALQRLQHAAWGHWALPLRRQGPPRSSRASLLDTSSFPKPTPLQRQGGAPQQAGGLASRLGFVLLGPQVLQQHCRVVGSAAHKAKEALGGVKKWREREVSQKRSEGAGHEGKGHSWLSFGAGEGAPK